MKGATNNRWSFTCEIHKPWEEEMKFLLLLLAVFIITSCVTHIGKETVDELDGNWSVMSFISAGEKGSAEEAGRYLVVFQGGKFYVEKDGIEIQNGTYELTPGTHPKAANFTFNTGDKLKGKTALGIYKLTNDELTICFTAPSEEPKSEEERPMAFESTAENGYRLNVYGRITE